MKRIRIYRLPTYLIVLTILLFLVLWLSSSLVSAQPDSPAPSPEPQQDTNNSSQDETTPDCPNCTAEERFRHEIAMLIDFATQIAQLNDSLEPLSTDTIAYLRGIVRDLPLGSPSRTAIDLALSRKEQQQQQLEHQLQVERIAAQTSLEHARRQPAATATTPSTPETDDDDPLGLRNSVLATLGQKPVVTYTVPESPGRKATVTIILNGKSKALLIGDSYQWNEITYTLHSIVPTTSRPDKRQYDILVTNEKTKRTEKLPWRDPDPTS